MRKDLPNPFVPVPGPLEETKYEDKKEEKDGSKTKDTENDDTKNEEKPIEIDFDGLQRRVVVFPYPEGRFGQIAGIEGKALFTSFP